MTIGSLPRGPHCAGGFKGRSHGGGRLRAISCGGGALTAPKSGKQKVMARTAMVPFAQDSSSDNRRPAQDRRVSRARRPMGSGWGCLLVLVICLVGLWGCAEVTKPTPTAHQIEAAQLATARRHPYQNWSGERVSRVFLRLLPWLPVTQGRTYPFLGFNWWLTATGQVVVDQVWYPSPAREAGLRRGDLIVAVNNWPLPTWVEVWDKVIGTTRSIFQDFSLTGGRAAAGRSSRARSSNQYAVSYVLPGELLAAILLDLKHIRMETQERYLTGPVELLVEREGRKFTLTLYPQRLPAEYAILVKTQDRKINAYAAPGQVILTQRLVSFCLNDDELALIVGHEMAHQVLGHIVRGAAHRELGQLLGEVITAASTLSLGRLLDWKHIRVDPDVRQVAQNAVVSVFTPDEEREADIYGAWYAFQAGYNLDRGAAVWERVAAVDEKDPFLTTYFLASHPAPMERIVRLQLVAQYFKAGRAAEVFLQTADLNRRPPPAPPVRDALEPPRPAPPVRDDSPGAGASSPRERDGHPGPAGLAVHPDLSLIGGQKPAHHEQPQAGPIPVGSLPGREERLEDPG
jgi:Zn-dependent protease with chaperone function